MRPTSTFPHPPHPPLGGPQAHGWCPRAGAASRPPWTSNLSARVGGEPPRAPPPVRVRPGRLQTSAIRVITTTFVRPSRGGPTGHGLMAGRGPQKSAGLAGGPRPTFFLHRFRQRWRPPHLAGKIALSVAACEVGKTSDCSRGAGNTPGTATILNRPASARRRRGGIFFPFGPRSVDFMPRSPRSVDIAGERERPRAAP